MIVRSLLGVLHFNAIVNAEQAYTKGKSPRFKLHFSKVSQCYVVMPEREVPEKAYLENVMSEIIELAKLGGHSGLPCIPERELNLEKPSKEVIHAFLRKFVSQILNYTTGIWQPRKLIY